MMIIFFATYKLWWQLFGICLGKFERVSKGRANDNMLYVNQVIHR